MFLTPKGTNYAFNGSYQKIAKKLCMILTLKGLKYVIYMVPTKNQQTMP